MLKNLSLPTFEIPPPSPFHQKRWRACSNEPRATPALVERTLPISLPKFHYCKSANVPLDKIPYIIHKRTYRVPLRQIKPCVFLSGSTLKRKIIRNGNEWPCDEKHKRKAGFYLIKLWSNCATYCTVLV